MAQQQLDEAYKLGRTLGEGTFATVRCATCLKTKKKWAVKIIDRFALTADDEQSLKMEIKILEETNHDHIVKVKEVFYSKKYVSLIMELMSGGELFDRIVAKDHYSEKEGKDALIDIVKALDYCHSRNIVHRDLKPENILYASTADDAPLKLADFGLAHLLKPNEMMSVACGTPGYVAPEVLQGHFYGKEVDMWSVGVVLYILLCGFPPFYDESNKALFQQIIHARYQFMDPYWTDVSDTAKDLVSKLLQVDPKKRYTTKQVLAHPWVKDKNAAKATDLTMVKQNLKAYNAKRRFRGAIRAVMLSNMLQKVQTGFSLPSVSAAVANEERVMDEPVAVVPVEISTEAVVEQTAAPTDPVTA